MRRGLRWLVTFVGFPLGGLLAELVVGPVDTPLAAIAGGALTGLIVGAVQAWALRPRGDLARAVDRRDRRRPRRRTRGGRRRGRLRHELGDLAIQGAICGLAVGAAQALVLRNRLGSVAFVWAPALGGDLGARLDDHRRRSASTSSASTRCSARAVRSPSPLATDGAAVRLGPRRRPERVVSAATTVGTGSDRRWLALSVLCVSLFAIVLDNTIVNVALPTLVRDLDADISQLQWVVDAYTLVFAGLLLLAGTLGDRYGRRRTLLLGLAVFGAASAAAAFAGGVDQLVVARAVMGAGAAFIMPATLSLLTHVFTDTRERAMAIGIWAATAGAGVALGPVLGGVLLDHFWWGSIFIVNVPVVARRDHRRAAPRAGVARCRVAPHRLARRGALGGRSRRARVGGHRGAGRRGGDRRRCSRRSRSRSSTLTAFVVWQRRAPEPLLDVRLFRNASFTAASTTIMLLFFALFGFLFLSTQYLQFVLGYSPSAAGVRMLPYAGAMIVAAPLSAKLAARFGVRRVVTAGMLCFAAGLARRGDDHHRHRVRPTRHRHARDGGRDGPGRHAGDGVDHELGAARPRQRRLGGQRHDARARRRARRRDRRQHRVVALRLAARRRVAVRRARAGGGGRARVGGRRGADDRRVWARRSPTPPARRSCTRCRGDASSSR